MNGRRISLVFALVVLIVLFAAWLDGGEEPLRPIQQPVPVPGGAS